MENSQQANQINVQAQGGQTQQNYQGEQQHVCPNCGFCPCCGRRNGQYAYPYPYTPYPYPYTGPYWGINGTGTISSDQTFTVWNGLSGGSAGLGAASAQMF